MNQNRIRAGRLLLLAVLLSSLFLVACGPTPGPTPLPTNTPLPPPTLRPTFTPTSLARATIESSPTGSTGQDETTPQPGDMPEPSDTPATASQPTSEPTPAATRAAGPPPDLSGALLFPVFDTTD